MLSLKLKIISLSKHNKIDLLQNILETERFNLAMGRSADRFKAKKKVKYCTNKISKLKMEV